VVAAIGTTGLTGQAAVHNKKPPVAVVRAAATYTVKRGDTLSAISARLHLDVAALAAANGLRNIHRLSIGQVLKVPPPPAAAGTAGLPDRLLASPERLVLMPHFDAAARDYKVPPDLIKAVAWMESGWQNDKVSSTKAVGIGQLMPDTVAFVNQQLLRARLDPKRPEQNIRLSARYLAWLLAQTKGDVPTAVGAYYQGLASVRKIGPYADTRFYVASVVALRARFS
jgi:soluble lytic murein transglycosylase-like protein